MENTPVEKTPEQLAIENQLGVINVVEELFRAMQAGSFPLQFMQAASNGMSFLAQFHKQLIAKLPPATLEELKRKQAPEAVAAPQEATSANPA